MGKLTERHAQLLTALFSDVMGWGERGLMHVLEQCQEDDPRAVTLALARISLDERMDGPGILPQHGQHWRDTDVATRPHRVLCPHGRTADTNVGNATTSSTCSECHPKPALTREQIREIRQRELAATAPNRQATHIALHGRTET